MESWQKELMDIEKAIDRVITMIEKSCIGSRNTESIVDNLKEAAYEVHHLVPEEQVGGK